MPISRIDAYVAAALRAVNADVLEPDDGLYVSVRFSHATVGRLLAWCRANRLRSHLAADEFHTTVVYSRRPVAGFECLGEIKPRIVIESAFTPDLFGPEKDCLVLKYTSTFLQGRHDYAKRLGASYDFPTYVPHVTVALDVPRRFDVGDLMPFRGPLVVVSEQAEPIREDYKSKIEQVEP